MKKTILSLEKNREPIKFFLSFMDISFGFLSVLFSQLTDLSLLITSLNNSIS